MPSTFQYNASADAPPLVPPPCASGDCSPCATDAGAFQSTSDGLASFAAPPRPTQATLLAHLPRFLASRCSVQSGVSLCGTPYLRSFDAAYVQAALAAAAAAEARHAAVPAPEAPGSIAFGGYFAPLRSQADFIAAQGSSRRLADVFSKTVGRRVYVFSPFLPFFEAYPGLRDRAAASLLAACMCAFVFSWLALRSAPAAAALAAVVGASAVQLAWLSSVAVGTTLNALSLANIAALPGLALQFSIHIAARAVAARQLGGSASEAAAAGLQGAGGLVLRGVAATKLVGVAALCFSQTPVFRKYYLGQYALLLLLCFANALITLPCLLAMLLPAGVAAPEQPAPVPRREWAAVRRPAEAFRAEARKKGGDTEGGVSEPLLQGAERSDEEGDAAQSQALKDKD